MSDEIKTIHVHRKGPSRSKPGGVSVIGHHRVEDGFVVNIEPNGMFRRNGTELASARWRE